MAKIRTASGLTGVSFLFRDGTGLRPIAAPKIRTVTGLVNLYGAGGGGGAGGSAFAAQVNATSVYGAVDRKFSAPVTSNAVTVTATGGQPPYGYAWAVDEGVVAVSPNSATTAFRKSLAPGDSASATAVCTVTDSAARTVSSASVFVQLENYGNGTNL